MIRNKLPMLIIVLVFIASMAFLFYFNSDYYFIRKTIEEIKGVEVTSIHGSFDEGLDILITTENKSELSIGTSSKNSFQTGNGFWVSKANAVSPFLVSCQSGILSWSSSIKLEKNVVFTESLVNKISALDSLLFNFEGVYKSINGLPLCPDYIESNDTNRKVRMCKALSSQKSDKSFAEKVFPCGEQ